MRSFIARHGKLLFILLTMVVVFVVFFAGRAMLQQMISVKVHSGMCRSKPDAPAVPHVRILIRND